VFKVLVVAPSTVDIVQSFQKGTHKDNISIRKTLTFEGTVRPFHSTTDSQGLHKYRCYVEGQWNKKMKKVKNNNQLAIFCCFLLLYSNLIEQWFVYT